MVEAPVRGSERSESVPPRRMRARAQVDPPQDGACRQDMDLGRDRAQRRDRGRRRNPIGHELARCRSEARCELGHDVGIIPGLKPLERSQRPSLPFPLLEIGIRHVEPAVDRNWVQALR